jgi:hypothetical protein
MSFFGTKSWRHHGLALVSALLLLLSTALAFAAGRIEWANKTLKPRSDNVSWNVEITIFMPNAPDVPSVPTKFIFQQTVRYERSILDGDKHVEIKQPVEGVQPIVESVDVGFLDPLSGKIQKRTKFTFKLHRDHGFECGEYKVTVRDARNDTMIGQPTTLIFGGQNEEVDRRSVVFTGEPKKKKKDAAKTAEGTQKVDLNEPDEKSSEGAKADHDKPATATNPNELPPEEGNPVKDEELKKKPGGCGCSVPGQSRGLGWGWLIASSLLLIGRRRSLKRAA